MDDLYANAWNDPTDPPLSDLKPSTSSSTWLSPRLPDAHEEADLAAPSWSTGAGVHWNEPSDSAGFSWGQADTDLAWNSSTYEGIQIAKPASAPAPEPHDTEGDDAPAVEPQSAEEEAPESPIEVRGLSPPPSPVQEVLAIAVPLADVEVLSPPAEHDAFGTFESALVPDEDSALALEETTLDAGAWGSAWASESEAKVAQEAEPVDEWEAARQRKIQQDRKVPPAVITALLSECEQFCEEIWPKHEAADAAVKDAHAADKDTAAVDKDDWRNNWRRGLEGVEGL